MLYFDIALINPWSKLKFNNLFCRSGIIYGNKAWEVEVIHYPALLKFKVEWSTRRDHAGIALEIGLLNYTLSFNVYDTRHWDHTNETWE